MAFKLKQATKIISDWERLLKTNRKILLPYINIEQYQGYVDVLKNIVKQSNGGNVSFKDYGQLRSYMYAVQRLNLFFKLPSIDQQPLLPTYDKIRKAYIHWRAIRAHVGIDPDYIAMAQEKYLPLIKYMKPSRAQLKARQFLLSYYDPVKAFKTDQAKYTSIFENVLKKIRADNPDKTEKLMKNVFIDFRKLNREQTTAVYKIQRWAHLPVDPKYAISEGEVEGILGSLVQQYLLPKPKQQGKSKKETEALEAQANSNLTGMEADAVAKIEEAAKNKGKIPLPQREQQLLEALGKTFNPSAPGARENLRNEVHQAGALAKRIDQLQESLLLGS